MDDAALARVPDTDYDAIGAACRQHLTCDEPQPKAMRARFSKATPGIAALGIPLSIPRARRALSSSKLRLGNDEERARLDRPRTAAVAFP